MEKEVLKEPMFVEEIIAIIRSGEPDWVIAEDLRDYHKNDIAQSLEELTKEERMHLYDILGAEWFSEILSFIDEPEEFIEELGVDKLAAVINEMDSDDAVDLLDDIDEELKNKIRPILDEDVRADIQLIHSYEDDEMGDDYAKLAGLTSEENLKETTKESMKKRLPWLIILLFLGMGVSTVVGAFEGVVAVLPIVICFQSLILDMAGNVGTQSLAVTIRVLMDEELTARDKMHLVIKEIKVGFSNGLLLGVLALSFLGLYIKIFKGYALGTAFLISGCVGISLLVAMIISSMVGTLVPLFFHKIKVDPAVASGPLITTVNDLVAVVTYYGLAWMLLIQVMNIA